MSKRFVLAAAVAALAAVVSVAQAADGLLTTQSAHGVKQTTDRLEQALLAADFKVFARVDHGAGAASVDMPLPATELLIFGKPKAGTALMQSGRTMGIDLPLKYLVWEDASGKVTIGWNDPAWLAQRHAVTDKGPVVKKVSGALKKFATEAAAP